MSDVELIHIKAIERASESDRLWFDNHPTRRFRLRYAVAFEFNAPLSVAPPHANWRVIVATIPGIGVRFRVNVLLSTSRTNKSFDDQKLGLAFERLAPPFMLDLLRGCPALTAGRTPPSAGGSHAQG